MNTNSDKYGEAGRSSYKLTVILLIGVLLMQVAIFFAIIHSRKSSNDADNIKTDLLDSYKKTTEQSNRTTNELASPFSIIDHEMAHFMNAVFQNSRQSRRNVNLRQRRMMQTINSAMQDMSFFSDLMNIDTGWDTINISPAMDMREKKDAYEINFSIPDGSASNVTVELNGQLLNMYIPIQIKKPGYNEFRTYKQQILIPGPIDTNADIRAIISNNVLRVVLPKRQR